MWAPKSRVLVRQTHIKASDCPMPDTFASRKTQGIPVLVLEEGHTGQAGRIVPIFQIGKQTQTGKGAHPRSESTSSFQRLQAGLGQYTYLPHDGQLHGSPSVGSPVHQARQEVSNESPCNCGQEQGEPGQRDTQRDSSPPAHPQLGSHAFTCLLIHSFVRVEAVPSLLGTLCSL